MREELPVAAIASVSDLVNRLTGGSSGTPETLWFYKNNRINGTADGAPIAGRMMSFWRYDGIPGGGTAPTSAAIPDNTTAGGLLQADPGGGRQKWIVGGSTFGIAGGALVVYDRLLHHGNASGTVTTAQTVGGTLTRNTGGVGNQIWVEVYSQIGATGTTITASYTNQEGTSGRTTPAVSIGGTGLRESSRIIPLPLAAGDTGVQAVASVTLTATTGTAGAFGVTIARPLVVLQAALPSFGSWQSFLDGMQIPEVPTDACLALAYHPLTTTAPEQFGCVAMVEA